MARWSACVVFARFSSTLLHVQVLLVAGFFKSQQLFPRDPNFEMMMKHFVGMSHNMGFVLLFVYMGFLSLVVICLFGVPGLGFML